VSGQRKALIIAVDDYEHEGLGNLSAPSADAKELSRVLSDPRVGDFAVQVARNEPAHAIRRLVEDLFLESRPDDMLLLHFSGHGLKNDSGELFFAGSDTRPDRLGSTAVPAEFVHQSMHAARSRSVVLLLDCCYGGAFARGFRVRAAGNANVLSSFADGRPHDGRGRAVITASSAMEYAFEGGWLASKQDRHPSVFTSALVEGLATGDADRDEDGYVSLNELYDYVFEKVQERNPHQTPSRRFEMEGDLYVARSQRRRIRPAPMPEELQAALSDQSMYARRGAIPELGELLDSPDLPVAAGAYGALATLARTDVPYVAVLASATARHAEVRPEKAELTFGIQRQGSEPAHRTVRLLGPHIARACTARASHDQIGVNLAPEGLDIWINTATPGILHGSVSVQGPTGTAEISVSGEVTSPVRRVTRARFLYVCAILPIVLGGLALALASPHGLRAGQGGQALFGVGPPSDTGAVAQLLILVIGACLAGTANSVEFFRERPIYIRERAAGQSATAYLLSKAIVLGLITVVQVVILFGIGMARSFGELPDTGPGPLGIRALLYLLITMIVLSVTSMSLGLLLTALVPAYEVAMPILVVITMAQVVLSGGTGLLTGNIPGLAQISWLSPSFWGMNALASTVDLNSIAQVPLGQKAVHYWDTGQWAMNVAALAVLAVVFLAIANWRLTRLTPGRRK
jgi:ABC-type transport system involved in multi-copper enzyme maturation permease subunit